MGTVSAAVACNGAGVATAFPHVWRANELAACRTRTFATGYPLLDAELPDGGWPSGVLIELLTQQPGIGEMLLLQTALQQTGSRAIALVQPPHPPQAVSWAVDGFSTERLVWVKAQRSADALWAAEQILRNGSCSALVLWQMQVRNESLRRLHLAAQASDVVFWLVRSLAVAQDASPAPLRLALRPAAGGIRIDIVKRRGRHRDESLFLSLRPMPADDLKPFNGNHAPVDKRTSSPVTARNVSSSLV